MRTSLSRSRERGREKRGIYESRRKTIEKNELLNASFAATGERDRHDDDDDARVRRQVPLSVVLRSRKSAVRGLKEERGGENRK